MTVYYIKKVSESDDNITFSVSKDSSDSLISFNSDSTDGTIVAMDAAPYIDQVKGSENRSVTTILNIYQ